MTVEPNSAETTSKDDLLTEDDLLRMILDYLRVKYMFELHYDIDYIYMTLKAGRLAIPFIDLAEFIDENFIEYKSKGFTLFDLADIYIMLMVTNTLDDLTNTEFQNNSETLLQ
jgi:hypothetical protein